MPSFYVFSFTVYLILALGIGTQLVFRRNRTLRLIFSALLVYATCIPTLFLALNHFPSGLVLFSLALIVSTGLFLRALTHEMMLARPFLLRFAFLFIITAILVFSLYKTHPMLSIRLTLIVSGGFLLVSILAYWFSHAGDAIPGSRGVAINMALWSLAKVVMGLGMEVILINPGLTSSIAVGIDGLLGFSITMAIIRMVFLHLQQQETQRLQEFRRAASLIARASQSDQFSALLENICNSVSPSNQYLLVTLEVTGHDQPLLTYGNQSQLAGTQVEAIARERDLARDNMIGESRYLDSEELEQLVATRQYLPGVKGVAIVEIAYDNHRVGSLCLYKNSSQWSSLEQVMALAYASLAGILIHNYQATNRLEASINEMVAALSMAVDARDAYTANHSRQVGDLSIYLAEQLALPGEEQELIKMAALLHDIGKIGIPDRVLLKTEKLSANEYSIIKQHPVIGANILGMAPQIFGDILLLVSSHHEYWDGSGYPRGLKEDAIPMGARILAVADSLDAMVSDRVYRQGMELEQAISEINFNRGTQFDPQVVDALTSLLGDKSDLINSWVSKSKKFKQSA